LCFIVIIFLHKKNSSLNSADKGGFFDIVIGNPPYIDSELMTNIGMDYLRKYIVKKYKFISGNWDIYMAFFEKGLSISKNILCYITPDKWLSKPFGSNFRKNCMIPKMYKITHVGSNIFDNVRVDGIISFFNQKSEYLSTFKFEHKNEINIKKITTAKKIDIQPPYYIDYLFSIYSEIIIKIETPISKRMSDYAICESACATNDAYKLIPFIIDKSNFDKENEFMLINTGTLDKYNHKWGLRKIKYLEKELGNKLLYPIVKRDEFIKNFSKSYVEKAIKPKIIIKGLNLLDACIDFDGSILPAKTTLVICNQNIELLKYLCAIINSNITSFYIKIKYASSSYCGGITFTKEMLNNFPIPNISLEQQKIIINIVDKIISIKKSNPSADTTTFENEIDALVYQLYGLTKEEITIIEKPNKD